MKLNHVYTVIASITNVKVFITIMNKKILTNKDIIPKLIEITGVKSASELARRLGTERQNLKSYENKEGLDLNNRIISLLIQMIEKDN